MIAYLNWPGKVAGLMAISAYLLVGWWLFFPYQPFKFNSINIKGPVTGGDRMVYEVSYTKRIAYPVIEVTRQLINGTVITLAKVQGSNLPIGCHTIRIPVNLPLMMEPGIYTLHISALYKVNPIRTVRVSAESNEFEVL